MLAWFLAVSRRARCCSAGAGVRVGPALRSKRFRRLALAYLSSVARGSSASGLGCVVLGGGLREGNIELHFIADEDENVLDLTLRL